MSDFEPGDMMVEALRRANPVPVSDGPGRRALPDADTLFADIVGHRPRRVPNRVLVVAMVIVVLVALVLAFVLVRREHARLPVGTSCYAAADLHAPKVIVESSGDPASVCRQLWESGRLGTGPVPSFDACVLPTGLLAVFPGESGSVCPSLGLPEAASDGGVGAFVHDVNAEISGHCSDLDRAEQIVSGELTKHGLVGWNVTPSATAFQENQCASIAIIAAKRTVLIVPEGNAFAP